jgi:hypothetical protein
MTISIMECIISSKYLFINFLIKYMEICQNPKEFHLIRQISKGFSTVIDPNFMHIDHDFNIIGNINDIKIIFKIWDLFPSTWNPTYICSKLSLYKNINSTECRIICLKYGYILPNLLFLPLNYVHILDYKPVPKLVETSWPKPSNNSWCWGPELWNVIHKTYYTQPCAYTPNNMSIKPINIKSIYGKKLKYTTNHDFGIHQKSNKSKYTKHNINNKVPKCSKRPKTIKYHR